MCMPWGQEQWRSQAAQGNAVIVGEYKSANGQTTALLTQDSYGDVYNVYSEDGQITEAFWYRVRDVEGQLELARQTLADVGYTLIQPTDQVDTAGVAGQETSETASASA